VRIPWEIPVAPSWSGSNGRLRIGVMWHDDVVLPQPPICRALKMLVDVLRTDPALEIVEYKPFKHLEAGALAVSRVSSFYFRALAHSPDPQHELYFVDGGEYVRARAAASGEPVLPLTEWVITLPSVKNHTVHELWEVRFFFLFGSTKMTLHSIDESQKRGTPSRISPVLQCAKCRFCSMPSGCWTRPGSRNMQILGVIKSVFGISPILTTVFQIHERLEFRRLSRCRFPYRPLFRPPNRREKHYSPLVHERSRQIQL
jgi:hypothetical protein